MTTATGTRYATRCCDECITAASDHANEAGVGTADPILLGLISIQFGAEIADHTCDREYGDGCCCACGEIA